MPCARDNQTSALLVALMGMHAFQVREHDVGIQRVTMLGAGMLDHRARDGLLVVAVEVTTTPGAGQLERHDAHPP